MTNQNRWNEGRSRSAFDDDDDRREQRRDRDDDWRRNDQSERNFGQDDRYGRGNRSYGGMGGSRGGHEDYGQESGSRGSYGGGQGYGSQDFGSQRRGGGQEFGSQRYGAGQDYGSQRYGSGQDFGSQRYGGQDFGSQRYGGQDFGQRHGGQNYGGQRGYTGQDYGSEPYSYVGQSHGNQLREGQYGRSGYGTPQYGAFGATEGGRQGRDWHQLGSGTPQHIGGWQRGEHRGKGPKGYKRSDDRIREDVCDRLSDDDELDASDITVTVKDGEVTLEGTVSDRHEKQRAEDLAESVGGVRDVDNKLRKNKGMLQEMSERLTGSQNNERGGHAGSGTKNTPPNASMSR